MPRNSKALDQTQAAKLFSELGVTLVGRYRTVDTYVSLQGACGHVFDSSLSVLRRTRTTTCPTCSYDKQGRLNALDLDIVLDKIRVSGATPLFDQYLNEDQSLPFICATPGCGAIHFTKWWSLRRRTPKPLRCFGCRNLNLPRGADHGRFDPSLSDEDRRQWRARPSEIQVWYRAVLKQANFTCQLSGDRGGKLAAHHLFNYADYPEKRFDLTNGVCLRRDLHELFHDVYGRGQNTPEQFSKFSRAWQSLVVI